MKKIVLLSLLAMIFAGCEYIETDFGSRAGQYGSASDKAEHVEPSKVEADSTLVEDVPLSYLYETWQVPQYPAPWMSNSARVSQKPWLFNYPEQEESKSPGTASR